MVFISNGKLKNKSIIYDVLHLHLAYYIQQKFHVSYWYWTKWSRSKKLLGSPFISNYYYYYSHKIWIQSRDQTSEQIYLPSSKIIAAGISNQWAALKRSPFLLNNLLYNSLKYTHCAIHSVEKVTNKKILCKLPLLVDLCWNVLVLYLGWHTGEQLHDPSQKLWYILVITITNLM